MFSSGSFLVMKTTLMLACGLFEHAGLDHLSKPKVHVMVMDTLCVREREQYE